MLLSSIQAVLTDPSVFVPVLPSTPLSLSLSVSFSSQPGEAEGRPPRSRDLLQGLCPLEGGFSLPLLPGAS